MVAEGIWAVVLAAATVVMALADNSGNGEVGNNGGGRGSGRATTINQNVAAVGAKMAVVAAAMDVAVSVAAMAEAVAAAVKWQGQIVAAATMVIAQFTLEGVLFHMGIHISNGQQYVGYFWIIGTANVFICSRK